MTAADTSTEWDYNENNELTGYDDVTFDYDLNGNMIEKNAGGVVTKFFYNLEDRLERVEDGSGNVIASYHYDPFGRRLWKDVAGTRTCFHYSDEGLVGEYEATGAVIKTYGWKPGSTWSTDPLFMKIGSAYYYYYHNDHLGTPQKMTSASGAVVWSATYSSFGEVSIDVGAVTNNLRFSGQYFDAESGLHYNCYRYYDPVSGRYMTPDPSHSIAGGNSRIYFMVPHLLKTPQELHNYHYTQNNSINYIDSSGLRTYRCRRPLAALRGSGERSGPDVPGNPLYHQYLCVERGGVVTCCGQTGQDDRFYGLGAPSNDDFNPENCELIGANRCIDNCLLQRFNNQRPNYGLVGPGTNCQEWSDNQFQECFDNCF
ncbi:RHS repeat domain-containing protein [Desulfosarcina ovata]|uniref:RHS repeat domain-containing protein n=1 Tax=Desulfosarcina ovata TaxID=83564 RepID=UPI0012D2F75A|nr:RHS repeat-associated core domain-containing protein [Desulfosarcina ovata]